jgi:superfamily II DNA helicase RecQ
MSDEFPEYRGLTIEQASEAADRLVLDNSHLVSEWPERFRRLHALQSIMGRKPGDLVVKVCDFPEPKESV